MSKAASEFYVDRRYDRPRTICIECCIANKGPNSGKRTPVRRAEYARERGETTVAYVPRDDRAKIAEAKRLARQAERDKPRPALKTMHDAHIKAYKSVLNTAAWRDQYKNNPEFAAAQRLRTQIRKKMKLYPKLDDLLRSAICRHGSSGIVDSVCGFTIAQFVEHFEQLFTDGMSWNAFSHGEIHIDHIRPQALFDMNNVDQVRECWALSNLQPLWAVDNLRKGARTAVTADGDRLGQKRYFRHLHKTWALRAALVHQL
ncbi:MAG: hypothetical protein WA777_20110 [Rhodanobacter sp.]